MTKTAYLAELTECLKGIPEDEINKTIAYYNEIIEDRMEEGQTEEKAVDGLDHPSEVARQLLVELLTRATGTESSESSRRSEAYVLKKQQFSTEIIREVLLREENAPIRIECSPDEWIHLSYGENERERYELQQTDGCLSVIKRRLRMKRSNWNNRCNPPVLTIALPQQMTGRVTAESVNAGISAVQIQLAGELRLKTSNARLRLEECIAQSITALTSNASITLKNVQAEQGVKAITDNGGIQASNVHCGSALKLQTDNAKIAFEQVTAGTELTFRTTNGSIVGHLTEPTDTFRIISCTSNGSSNLPTKWGKGSIQLTATTSNGNIQIDFPDSDD